MRAIVVGSDEEEIGPALSERGVEVLGIEGIATRPALEEAGIMEADLLVLTDVGQATTIPIAKNLDRDVRIVVYDRQSLPEFVSAQTDLAVDPELLGPEAIAEALVEE